MDATNIDLYANTRHLERLFILGAGFSCSVSKDFPLTRDLLERVFDEDKALPAMWANLASLFTPFLRAREASGTPEITSVLTALEAYRAIVGKLGPADAKIRELQTRVLYGAAALLHRASAATAGSRLMKDFCDRLDPTRDAILTMNWDVAPEYELKGRAIGYQYDVLPTVSGADRPEKLLVLKPQGSVTWARVNPLPNVSSPVLAVGPPPPAPHWILSERLGAPPTFGNPGPVPSDPAIIPPGFIGEERSRELYWSGYLLRVATYAALQAKKIVVVGYSLPPDDFHILTALSFGIPQDSWGDGVEVFVVDPSTSTFQQWRNAFHGLTTRSGKAVSVRHWAPNLEVALQRPGGPWA